MSVLVALKRGTVSVFGDESFSRQVIGASEFAGDTGRVDIGLQLQGEECDGRLVQASHSDASQCRQGIGRLKHTAVAHVWLQDGVRPKKIEHASSRASTMWQTKAPKHSIER